MAARLMEERGNFEACLARALGERSPQGAHAALLAIVALNTIAGDRGLRTADLTRIDEVIEAARRPESGVEHRLLGRALIARANKREATNNVRGAEEDCRSAIALGDQHGDKTLLAAGQNRLARLLFSVFGQPDEALTLITATSALYRELGDAVGEVQYLLTEGDSLQSLNRSEEAFACFERALALSRAHRFPRGEARATWGLAFYYMLQGQLELCRRHFEHSIALARTVGLHRHAMLATGYSGLFYLVFDQPTEAAEQLSVAIAEARETGHLTAEGVFLALQGAILAGMDEIHNAEAAFEASQSRLADCPFLLRATSIHRGHLDLAKARRALTFGDLEASARHRADAEARVKVARIPEGDSAPIADVSDDARAALQILERALDRANSAQTDPSKTSRSCVVLEVTPGATSFRVGSDPPVDLSKRAALRRILDALAKKREQAPDEPIEGSQLVVAGWPHEKIARSAALNRLHVALATLRSLGLRDVLLRQGDGYLLDPRVTLCRTTGEKEDGSCPLSTTARPEQERCRTRA